MKFLYFDDFQLGVLRGDQVVDITAEVKDVPHTDNRDLINGLIGRFDAYKARIEKAVAGGKGIPLSGVRIRPPLPRPGNIDCMAVNYREGKEAAAINAFQKAPGAIIGDGDTMVLPDVPAGVFEGEAELALVIGKRATNVRAADAMGHVFGYLNFIDGSARGLLPANNTFFQMKSRETFAPIGPFLVTADEVPDPHKLHIRLWVNGNLKQDFNTDDMANNIPRCIEWLSSIHTLEPGYLVATGTNHGGLNAFHDGDKVELEVDGMGRLHFGVRDDLKRTWSRDTRHEHKQKGLEGAFTPQLTGKYAKAG